VPTEGDTDATAGALLVSLAAPEEQLETFGGELHILDVQGDELAATEGRCETQEQQRAIALGTQGIRKLARVLTLTLNAGIPCEIDLPRCRVAILQV
jgi:hypothetical protein